MGITQRAHNYGKAISSQTIAAQDATTSTALTVPAGTKSALITVGTNAARYRVDGTNPTASVGHYIAANGNVEIFEGDLALFEIISTTGTTAVMITYFGEN